MESTGSDAQTTKQKVSAMAWAGFQVLANRCVTWEQEDSTTVEELEHSGLARQVSILLTNHLARATECSGNEAAGSEALQEVLSLLNNLSRSRMGKAILSQPGCVSKLLSLLLDQRPSPKLVLIILQLCRVALPLMSASDCDKVELPVWGQEMQADYSQDSIMHAEKPVKIASLLLAKLGDFLVPGEVTTISSRRPSMDHLHGLSGGHGGDKEKGDDKDVQDGRLSIFIHKRADQSSHEVIQPLLSSDSRPFRLSGGTNMERVVRMDREMTKTGKAEITTEDAVSALRRAAKWAQMGLVVSTGPPAQETSTETNSGDKKKTTAEMVCKDKNAELSRTDPVRPFISGHVASSMAAEVIGLLHSLLTAPETHTAQLWASAVEQVISEALSCLPTMLHTMDDLSSVRGDHHRTMALAKQADAALAALGGFEEAVRPGCEVQITGPGVENCMGTVLTVSEQTGLASVALLPPTTEDYTPARYKDTVQVPLSRLRPPSSEPLPLHELSVSGTIVSAVQSLLLPQISGGSPLTQQLPIHGDGNSLPNQICRVVAEIRTRACRVLASHLRDLGFASAFIQHSSASIDILKSLAKDCEAGDRENVIAAQCQRLRLLYRDCAKPPPPPSKLPDRMTKEITFDTTRTFPPTRSCLFSHGLTAVTFLGDPSIGSGLPRGTIVYATQAVPNQAPSFYWELEISSFGDQSDEGGPTISFGFMPAAEKKDGAWTYPVGTCLFHNNGRAVHYNGSSLLQWRSLRLDVTLNSGDVAGIGWERQGDTPPLPGQPVTGCVYFTHNGRRLPRTMDNVAGSMWPVVHIQKRNTSIRGNFGSRPFTYAEGQHHRNAADECSDLTQEIKENFGVLPFNLGSDSDSEGPTSVSTSTTDTGSRDLKSPPGPPCKTVTHPKALRAYNPETSLQYRRQPCYENFTQTGPSGRSQTTQEDESDLDEGEEDQSTEDHYALLVKAWEQKVFPTIRRRFRNEAERKDGLEQIKGALQLGMTDIARQTVEFLYEENGGIPRDLHLPTIDDIKEELAKFTIERVRKGTTVVIRQPQGAGQAGTMVVPKFAVRPMLKTFGRTGIVLDIDQPNELVQVETYLRSEGVLVRYWYPLDMLEKPPQGYRKASSVISQTVLDTSNVHIHRELLRVEAILARMHCRSALLELISQCNSPAMEITNSANLSSAMAASAAVLQELDLENLQLLSNELLASPQPHGGVVATSLMSAVSPAQCLSSSQCSAVNVFYNEPDRLKEELKVAIARAANQGEDYLIELSNQICMCLQTAPEMFPYEEMRVTESKVETDLHFPDAAFLIVSCRIDPGATRKDTSLYKAPWARIFTYRGHRVKRSGHATKQEVVCYPRDTSSISTQSSQFAPVIIPADLVHVKIGVAPPPGYVVTIHAVPLQFPLAVAYIETLATVGYGFQYRHPDADLEAVLEVPPCGTHNDDYDLSVAPWRNFRSVQVTPTVLLQITELLCGFLWRTHLPAMMKESLFHLLAQTLRLLRKADAGISSLFPTLRQQPSTSLSLLTQLQAELQKLYEEETKGWPTATTASGTGMGLGVSDQGRFSTYFHSLLEVCLASSEVTSPGTTFVLGSPLAAASDTSSPGLPASMPAPTSPVGGGKRKKLKTKRERDSTSRAPRRSTSPRRLSEGDASPSTSGTSIHSSSSGSSVSGSSATLLGGTKTDDMLWFQRAVTMSQILRNLGQNDSLGEEVTNDAISDAFKTTCTPSAYSRLLVLTGLPPKLDKISAVQAIKKACNACGGLFKDEVFIPAQQTSTAGSAESKSPSDSVKSIDTSTEGQSDGESTTRRLAEALADESETSPRPGKSGSPPRALQEPFLKGYAVLQLRSKCKVDVAKNLLLKNRLLVSGSASETEELVEVPYDVLSISMVNQNLFAEEENGNEAIEAYLMDKLISNKESYELCDSAMIALTEIFHSCFINEQRVSPTERPESGYICLNWDQICSPATGNLLFTFLSSLKPPKRSVNDHIGQVLKKYGMPKLADKDESDRSDKSRPTRKASKPSKEKLVCGATAKPSSKDKKPRPKDIGEKGWREENEPSAKSSKEPPKESDRVLTLDGFLSFVVDHVKQDVKGIWRALLSTGFDFHFDRCACLDVSQAQQMALQWTPDMDVALVHYVNKVCRHLAISPSRLHPHELYLTDEDLSSMDYKDLQGVPCESLCLRFALLQSINTTMETFFLPLVDLRPVNSAVLSCSTAALLSQARGLVFYDTKVVLLNRILNTTALRKPDQAAPEVTLDPLEYVGGERRNPADTNFCQALRQLSNVPSSQLCVRIAAGGDPTYAFNVRMLGEEVHGTSGSFRHFLGHVSHELQSGEMSLLIPCATSATNRNRGKYLLRPGPMTYAEEQLLIFLGQLLGITLRADIPLGLDLLPLFWKNLVGVDLDPVSDLQDADLLTYNYVKKFEMAESEDDMHLLVGDSAPKFTYPTLTGEEVELIPNGRSITVSWENRQLYLDSIRSLRMDELHCKERTDVLRAGMASIMPPQLLYLLTPMDAQVRLSGIPEVNLDFLKAHTMYQVGLMDTDTHIEYFWNALETFSQEDLAKFIKFACNQERIPMTCPCQDGGPDTSHVPPYPMKIAPPDGSGSPDSRYIRVETCMFMVKLPQYSSQEVMTRRLMYAINCREDPLSG